MSEDQPRELPISLVTADDIRVRGASLGELIAKGDFISAFYYQAHGSFPDADEVKLLNAALTMSLEHGLTTPVTVARLTHAGAPEALQAAIAAGLLGCGSRSDGTMELVVDMLQSGLQESRQRNLSIDEVAQKILSEYGGRRVPGFGHDIHRDADPRTAALFQTAEAVGRRGEYIGLMEALARQISIARGRRLPINGAGAVGAVYAELGFSPGMAKGWALVAMAAGMVGHVADEIQRPLAREIRGAVRGVSP